MSDQNVVFFFGNALDKDMFLSDNRRKNRIQILTFKDED